MIIKYNILLHDIIDLKTKRYNTYEDMGWSWCGGDWFICYLREPLNPSMDEFIDKPTRMRLLDLLHKNLHISAFIQ